MSKTDKDRPYAVRAFFEGRINHSHVDGECRVETLNDMRSPVTRWRTPNHSCGKLEHIKFDCPGFIANEKYNYTADTCYTVRRQYYQLEHEINTYPWGAYTRRLLVLQLSRYAKRHFCGEQHTKTIRHRNRPCVECDKKPTCYRYVGYESRRYRSKVGVPKWFVDHTWNNPERVRERNTFREMIKDVNANFGDADTDFENFQHRHRSRWYWD